MNEPNFHIAVIRGDGIGVDVTNATLAVSDAAGVIEDAIQTGFAENRIRPMEFGGDMGTAAVTNELIDQIG